MKRKITDKFLLLKIQSGDPEAFAQIYDGYIDDIYRFVFYKVSHQHEAEDLSSEVFLKTWAYIKGGNSVKNVRALLYRIARNLVIDYYRTNKKRTAVNYEDLSEILASKDPHLDEEISFDELRLLLEKGIYSLTEDYRDIILLRYVEGLTIQEISEIMDRTKGACRVLLHRAIKALKLAIRKDQDLE
ncbi:MAG: RNA polymerase sigma factor [Candidatus Jacksonbacteria bacterium]|jgi:RNA polymerase sigma-70 factor, ECF subfamily|nr:RNA polymerase sigma factor [Candidatus Jacksonbacteria bacterium]MBT6034208.1 RNA polymerase sigma factor [Candidatus Jacksonbacteria bacterium]MBT6301508.1 RNA polymerase sigma factor [Candidatus Jacksonbacteria bacterium]MBT6757559.1 RNA polymerase sigma factor [Candidatus Jacksonbacteria bacterium]MBT6955289.1 RNA polymerase sigma factor [Candidatus Jacksonbacteria bacterium]